MIRQVWMIRFMCATVTCALLVTSSLFAQTTSPLAADLTVTGRTPAGEAAYALVNNETARSGRSVFTSSTVATPAGVTGVLNVASVARIQLDPESSAGFIFDRSMVDVNLTAGRLTVLGATGNVKVRTTDGRVTTLKSGESISASGMQTAPVAQKKFDDWWIVGLVAAGAVAAVVIAVAAGGNDDDNVVSPVR